MNKKILVISIISLLAISILSQDVSASVLSASMKNPPQSTADLFTLNNTAGIPLYHIDHTGKVFAANNADFHNSTVSFDSSKMLIRNPASTFAYTLTGGAIVANRTLNIPIITSTDTLAVLGLQQSFTTNKNFTSGLTISSVQPLILDGSGQTKITSSSAIMHFFISGNDTMDLAPGQLNILTTSAAGSSLPKVDFTQNSKFAANGTIINIIRSIAPNGAGSSTVYSTLISKAANTGTGIMNGQFQIQVQKAGSATTMFEVSGNTGVIIASNIGTNQTTGATTGHFYIPVTDGAPTGVPAGSTGSVALQFDGKTNKLYVYNGGWKSVQLS